MTVNLPVDAMSEKCINCPELELDVLTREKYELKAIDEKHTKSELTGFENYIKCKNWDEGNGICPVARKSKALVDAVIDIPPEPPAKAPTKKTTTRKTTVKKTVSKK